MEGSTKMPPKGFADLASMPENERIRLIGHVVVAHGQTVGVCVDDKKGTPERYIEKITKQFPTVVLLERFNGPVKHVVTLKFGPRPQ